ncbi:hypothetical protein Stsp02_37520 [Streptomyces sp. NBRC 14336]|uniref:hypothetical protein n=1 Tax=Streptomyces sp. NBRC 14336 TaxID=3030992 RepID=UPI0024A1EC85|nr:hypothetical protein [Streptomyces sp. NBRC 14336]WBO80833.1 hypothetical protein SBE_004644 [Streptomyces sp. SBE_14.2]GLW48090.1 hypothetical protein Stsp02_37520 [Streptomyces sp. NBRC 14336]
MNRGLVCAALAVVSALTLLGGTAAAAPADGAGPARSCAGVRLTGSLPVPPPGTAVERTVTIGEDCAPRLGPVRRVAARSARADNLAAAEATTRHVRSWNEEFDCCNIRMTGLYTTSDWTVADGRITTAATSATQGFNREPWDAGWSLASATDSQDCTTDCTAVNAVAEASFTYKGIFDVTGDWYANSHRSSVRLGADGTAQCTFDVELKHTFVGWNWRHGCE